MQLLQAGPSSRGTLPSPRPAQYARRSSRLLQHIHVQVTGRVSLSKGTNFCTKQKDHPLHQMEGWTAAYRQEVQPCRPQIWPLRLIGHQGTPKRLVTSMPLCR